MPLHEFLPEYDVCEIHSTVVRPPPERVIEAARDLTWRDVPVFAALMAVRSLPALLGRHRPAASPSDRRRLPASRVRGHAERPNELVFAAVGEFWKPTGGLRRVASAEFGGFDEPGFAKTAFNFRAEPEARAPADQPLG